MKDVGIPVGESDSSTTLPTYLLHELHPSPLGHLNRDEVVAPAFRLTFDGQERNVSSGAITVPTTLLLANSRSVTGTTRGSPRQGQTANSKTAAMKVLIAVEARLPEATHRADPVQLLLNERETRTDATVSICAWALSQSSLCLDPVPAPPPSPFGTARCPSP